MSKPALPLSSPTHLGRLITRCPKGIHTAVVFSRACDTRAHPWTLALFAFTTFTEQQKIRTIFNPKLKTKTAQKTSCTSTKTWEILTKTWEFFEKTWEIFGKTWEKILEISDVLFLAREKWRGGDESRKRKIATSVSWYDNLTRTLCIYRRRKR